MARKTTFTFRVSSQEQRMLKRLAEKLQRSQSDSVRLLIREAVSQLDSAVSTKPIVGGGQHAN